MTVEVTNPPITAIAIGERSEAPSPKPNVIGRRARIVVSVVIRIGRIRCWPDSTMASVSSMPDCFNWLIRSTRIIELFTAIPTNITMPITPIILIVVPVRKNSRIAPTTASGIVNRIVKGCSSKVMANMDAGKSLDKVAEEIRQAVRLPVA